MELEALAEQTVAELYPEMVRWRRYLHQHPELSFQEKETSAWIEGKLREFGCEIQTGVGGHGIIAAIRGSLPGPVIALRADIDALPIQDEKECEYASKTPGIMHACGHDGHTATLLAIARFYNENRENLSGERRLIFQPAEEVTPGGAIDMVRAGALDGVDVIYGVHLWTPLPYGSASTKPGAFMSAADEFVIDIGGKGGHGGLPHHAIDSIIVGTALVQGLQSIVSRNVNPLHPAVLTIGSFQAGSTNNIIAEKCQLKGTVRSFDETTRFMIHERLEAFVRHTCDMYGAGHSYYMRVGYPPVVNDDKEAARFFSVAPSIFGEAGTREAEAITVAEDFSYYLLEKPGCFMFVGAGNPDCGAVYSHHHPKFDFDERAMKQAAALLIGMAEHYAREQAI